MPVADWPETRHNGTLIQLQRQLVVQPSDRF